MEWNANEFLQWFFIAMLWLASIFNSMSIRRK